MSKPKPKQTVPLVASISQERILQLLNDLAEDIDSGTAAEWRAVANWQTRENRMVTESLASVRMSVAALVISLEMQKLANSELRQWLDRGKAA